MASPITNTMIDSGIRITAAPATHEWLELSIMKAQKANSINIMPDSIIFVDFIFILLF